MLDYMINMGLTIITVNCCLFFVFRMNHPKKKTWWHQSRVPEIVKCASVSIDTYVVIHDLLYLMIYHFRRWSFHLSSSSLRMILTLSTHQWMRQSSRVKDYDGFDLRVSLSFDLRFFKIIWYFFSQELILILGNLLKSLSARFRS